MADINLKTDADAGKSFTSEPYVEPDKNHYGETYEQVRDTDKIETVLKNSSNLQFTEKNQNDYLRLLMPKYSRRVEVEDLDRNFWVIGQTLNYLSRKFYINISEEKFRFEKTLEKDRDEHNYSDYPHKIVFNEGVDGIKTPYSVKDYCYHSNELNDIFEEESIWYRQMGGFKSPDEAYLIGGGGTIPFLNFYKPRPDAIPIFSLTQTESSDIETFNAGNRYKKYKKSLQDEESYMNFLGKINTFLYDGHNNNIIINNQTIELLDSTHGQIVISNVPEISPIKVHGIIDTDLNPAEGVEELSQNRWKTYPDDTEREDHNKYPLDHYVIKRDADVVSYSTGGTIKFEQFSEGQIIYFIIDNKEKEYLPTLAQDEYYLRTEGYYIKTMKTGGHIKKHGYVFPKEYEWKKIDPFYYNIKALNDVRAIDGAGQLSGETFDIDGGSNIGLLALNYIDQKFMWVDGMWKNLDLMSFRDGPTVPLYRIVENGSMFRVLGDSSTDITGQVKTPTINGEPYGADIRDHDVVRYNGICYEWWNGSWRQIKECDASFVNIFIWLPERTATLRGVYYWTLKWLIPPGIGEYE